MAFKTSLAFFFFVTAFQVALTWGQGIEGDCPGSGGPGGVYDCQSRVCPAIYNPVCGTDGMTYGNPCELCWEKRCENPGLGIWYPGECWAKKVSERRRRRSLRQVKLPQEVIQELQDLSGAFLPN